VYNSNSSVMTMWFEEFLI